MSQSSSNPNESESNIPPTQSFIAKQRYLKTQIVEKGYDPNEFGSFIGHRKKEGDAYDLNNWSREELEEVVGNFKSGKSPMHADPINIQAKDPSQSGTGIEQRSSVKKNQAQEKLPVERKMRNSLESLPLGSIPATNQRLGGRGTKALQVPQKIIYKNHVWDYALSKTIECSKIQVKFPISDSSQIISDKFTIETQQGFLNYFNTYKLCLHIRSDFSQQVVRKLEDFDWLRKSLRARYPGVYIPHLTEVSEFDPSEKDKISIIIASRVKFLNDLLSFKHLAHSHLFLTFMTQADLSKFHQFQTLPIHPSPLETLSGVCQLELTERILKVNHQLKLTIQKTKSGYQKINQLTYKLQGYLEKVSNLLKKLKDEYLHLNKSMTESSELLQKPLKIQNLYSYFHHLLNATQVSISHHLTHIREINSKLSLPIIADLQEYEILNSTYEEQLERYIDFRQQVDCMKKKVIDHPSNWGLPEMKLNELREKSRDIIYTEILPEQSKKCDSMKENLALRAVQHKDSFVQLFQLIHKNSYREFKNFFLSIPNLTDQPRQIAGTFADIIPYE